MRGDENPLIPGWICHTEMFKLFDEGIHAYTSFLIPPEDTAARRAAAISLLSFSTLRSRKNSISSSENHALEPCRHREPLGSGTQIRTIGQATPSHYADQFQLWLPEREIERLERFPQQRLSPQ